MVGLLVLSSSSSSPRRRSRTSGSRPSTRSARSATCRRMPISPILWLVLVVAGGIAALRLAPHPLRLGRRGGALGLRHASPPRLPAEHAAGRAASHRGTGRGGCRSGDGIDGPERSMTLRQALPWVLLGALGWGYVAFLGASMLAGDPPTAGFDLALLLEAGRRVAEGASPYDPALIDGASVAATSLFYSYPPPVAAGHAARRRPRGSRRAGHLGPRRGHRRRRRWRGRGASGWIQTADRAARASDRGSAALRAALRHRHALREPQRLVPGAVRPDAHRRPGAGRRARVAAGDPGGIALAVVSIAKLHPASLGVWFLVRGWVDRDRDRRPWMVVAVAILAGFAILGVSLLVGGSRRGRTTSRSCGRARARTSWTLATPLRP